LNNDKCSSSEAVAPNKWRGEFDWIRHVQARAQRSLHGGVQLGIGDDCALLQAPAGEMLAVSTDTLVAGVHFFKDVAPAALGHKALAVNLSDLAAMGAKPLWFTLNITLPELEQSYVQGMVDAMLDLADQHQCQLVGGDTTRGPLSITITVFGSVPDAFALRRDGARLGDDIYVSGPLGAAAAAVELRKLGKPVSGERALALDFPTPRIALGLELRGIANSALDISDGLAGDLLHICRASGLDARIDADAVPVHAAPEDPSSPEHALQLALHGGDDYELCFTASPTQREAIQAIANKLGMHLVRIGTFTAASNAPKIELLHKSTCTELIGGYAHFNS
jgi:thiamine-monophosphate kinase